MQFIWYYVEVINELYMTDYRKLCDDFLAKYSKGSTTGEEVGYLVAQLAQVFAEANSATGRLEFAFNKLSASIVDSIDDNGKPIAVSKAEIVSKASPEYEKYNESKRELQSIEQYINAMKTLQRGQLNEYAHMSNT